MVSLFLLDEASVGVHPVPSGEESGSLPAPVAHQVHDSGTYESDHQKTVDEDSDTECESELLKHG